MPVVLVTGGARRIGAGIVAHCHQEGFNVIIHAHQSVNEANVLCQELNNIRPGSASVVLADLADTHACWQLIENAAGCFGQLDALVNCASQFYPTPIADASSDDWDNLMAVNLKAPFFLAKAAFSSLTLTHGCIVNITDVYAKKPLKHYPIYTVSKAGLQMLTQALAVEFAASVRVNGVAPGNILWPEGKDNQWSLHEKQDLLNRNLLKRQGLVDEIAKAVLFLIRDATFTTGAIIDVDGGRHIAN